MQSALANLDGNSRRFEFVIVPVEAAAQFTFKNPFNIYGDVAVSSSIIADANTSPVLEVSWSPERTKIRMKEFDSLWDEFRHTETKFLELAGDSDLPDGSAIGGLDFGLAAASDENV